MPTDLKTKRYLTAKYKLCKAVAGSTLGKTMDAVLGKYSDSVSAF